MARASAETRQPVPVMVIVAIAVVALATIVVVMRSGPSTNQSAVIEQITDVPVVETKASSAAKDAFRLQLVKGGFKQPTYVTHVPGTNRALVVERAGRIRYMHRGKLRTWVDLRRMVGIEGHEQGLLSIAFHPGFADNHRVFASWINKNGDTRVGEMLGWKRRATSGSMKVIFKARQPYETHNGGQLQFGPDGMLYFGMGDGGSVSDPQNRSQNLAVPHGKMLRFDVNGARGEKRVPADNPFAADGRGLERYIWGIGLRNPWRFSFDAKTGNMFIGDVGQESWEEVNYVQRGARLPRNFEWDAREGNRRHEGGTVVPYRNPPMLTYSHKVGCSVTGGFVYRGSAMPALRGFYLYADFCRNWLRGLAVKDGKPVGRFSKQGVQGVSSFGEGPGGEVYMTALDGNLYKLVPANA